MEATHIFNALLQHTHMLDVTKYVVLHRIRHQKLWVFYDILAHEFKLSYFLLFFGVMGISSKFKKYLFMRLI